MLLRLEIRDFAVISNIVFEPSYGLNCISGETGAGKSIILGALNLALGGKVDKNMVRDEEKDALVEAVVIGRPPVDLSEVFIKIKEDIAVGVGAEHDPIG